MNITDLISYVAPEVPGCNAITIERAIHDAVRAFCSATWAWEHAATAWIRAGKDTGVIRLPASMGICGIVSWKSETTREHPALYRDNEIQVRQAPAADVRYDLTLAVMPSRKETDFPDWLDARYREAITAYARHLLLMLPGKDWTNPGRAQTLYQIYTDAVNDVKRERNNNRLRGVMRVRVPGAL